MKKIIFAFILLSFLFSGCQTKKETEKLVIFHAGSLSVPFSQLEKEFEKENPNVDVIREASGSRKAARKITELGKNADIMASADYSVIEKLMFPEFATWDIAFVTNEMAIMYTPKSKYAKEINSKNWYKILMRPDVSLGRSNPNADPCGYRALLVLKLAEKYYKIPNLYKKLAEKKKTIMRNAEVDLISLLEAGELDYLFIYRSVAQQHNAKFIILPDQINLKTKKYTDFYKTVSVKISGKKPGTFIEKKGMPMIYGLTIPKNAKNKKLAVKFLKFLFSKKGMEIMEKNGQPFIKPPVLNGNVNNIPEEIRNTVKEIK